MQLLIHWIVNALAVLAAGYFVPGITVANFWVALIVAAVLALLNLIVKPILVLLTLPINLITLGLFTFVINGIILWLAGNIVKGIGIESLWAAILGALVISAIKLVAGSLLDK